VIDTWELPRSPHRASLKISRSEFIGIAFPLSNEEAFFEELQKIQKEFFDATHHCWAFRLFDAGVDRTRSSDAGEPSGTAGKPILNAIVSAEVSDAGVVVVRYYGGVKLGTGGLARAYRDAAQLVLSETPRERRYLYDEIDVIAPFNQMSQLYRLVDPPSVVLRNESFAHENIFTFAVRRSESERFQQNLLTMNFEIRRVG
jgi:uncharacterized YigZ family protein